ncbi:MAG: hypothetical protein O2855_06190 [Planctomycetota bacterium]|nr:hypothetical protein [Planctomycetota bacterium]
MHTHTLIAPLAALLALGACSSSQNAYDSAMRLAVTDLRGGNLDGASSALNDAREAANKDSQREKVQQLEILVDGAKAYERGDRAAAGNIWSDTESPELRSAILANARTLGVSLKSPSKN